MAMQLLTMPWSGSCSRTSSPRCRTFFNRCSTRLDLKAGSSQRVANQSAKQSPDEGGSTFRALTEDSIIELSNEMLLNLDHTG